MSIQYKVVEKGMPGVKGGGKKKFYAQMATDGECTVDDMVAEIEKFSALSEPDIRGVIVALENVIQNKLAESKIVRMDKLGSFYPSLHSEGKEKEEEINQHSIKRLSVIYRPGARILKTMANKGFQKIGGKG